jgi:hypothetical protein
MAASSSIDNRYDNNEVNAMQAQQPPYFENIAAQQHLPNYMHPYHLMNDRDRMRQNSLSKNYPQS